MQMQCRRGLCGRRYYEPNDALCTARGRVTCGLFPPLILWHSLLLCVPLSAADPVLWEGYKDQTMSDLRMGNKGG